MGKKKYDVNNTANESVSKYKLLSAYGGPGSLVHTQYGSVIISCIEDWGFLKKVIELDTRAVERQLNETERVKYVIEEAREGVHGNIGISNDKRLLESLQIRKGLINLKYLALIPDIEVVAFSNKIKVNVENAIPSTYFPKVFFDDNFNYKPYNKWYKKWVERRDNNNDLIDRHGIKFHPPKYILNEEKGWEKKLKQNNIILLCEHGHISDFPWSKFLRWRKDYPKAIFDDISVNIFDFQNCCDNPSIKITSNSGNASGFDGKWLKCFNCNYGVSLKGLMGVKILCPGHKPWESFTESNKDFPYSGNKDERIKEDPSRKEKCNSKDLNGNPKPMKVALTTGNNIYYSRILSSIFLHSELFESDDSLKKMKLESELKEALKSNDFQKCIEIKAKIEDLEINKLEVINVEIPDKEREIIYRYNEFKAFIKDESLLNKYPKHLKIKNVTNYLDNETSPYFNRVLRIDNMKITSAQLDFSRVVPIDADAEDTLPQNVFRSRKEQVLVYPVVENFGEGIFFSFNDELLSDFFKENNLILELGNQLSNIKKQNTNEFNQGAIEFANEMNWQLYLVHTFSHLIMRELEFRCGYPTASLSERIYVSNNDKYRMYGCLIYTAEGAEGSMGGVIAQTRPTNLNNLIKSAIKRATICNSDPLCWESEGQGLFDLNFASCFSCSLVSETSCEHRNLYLDRKILVDSEYGFFKNLI